MADVVHGVDVSVPYIITLANLWYKEDMRKVFNPGTYQLDGMMATKSIPCKTMTLATANPRTCIFGNNEKGYASVKCVQVPKLIETAHSFLINTNISMEDILSL